MGVFDTVYVSAEVTAAWQLRCGRCQRELECSHAWQTKSLDSGMYTYYLRHDEKGDIRLYFLDPPSDRSFWRPWTEDEIADSARRVAAGEEFSWLQKKPGGGHFLDDAFLPQHRRQRFMGELPHQWVEIHGSCACGHHVEYWVRFSDGIATEARSERPAAGEESLEGVELD